MDILYIYIHEDGNKYHHIPIVVTNFFSFMCRAKIEKEYGDSLTRLAKNSSGKEEMG